MLPDPVDLVVLFHERRHDVMNPELGENVVDLGLIDGITLQQGGAVPGDRE